MASQNPPKSYDEETLLALESALKGVLKILKAHDPSHNWEKDPELKRALAGKLMALADAGVRDPDELRNRTPGALFVGVDPFEAALHRANRDSLRIQEDEMDTTTILIIILVILVLGGGWYGRGRWY